MVSWINSNKGQGVCGHDVCPSFYFGNIYHHNIMLEKSLIQYKEYWNKTVIYGEPNAVIESITKLKSGLYLVVYKINKSVKAAYVDENGKRFISQTQVVAFPKSVSYDDPEAITAFLAKDSPEYVGYLLNGDALVVKKSAYAGSFDIFFGGILARSELSLSSTIVYIKAYNITMVSKAEYKDLEPNKGYDAEMVAITLKIREFRANFKYSPIQDSVWLELKRALTEKRSDNGADQANKILKSTLLLTNWIKGKTSSQQPMINFLDEIQNMATNYILNRRKKKATDVTTSVEHWMEVEAEPLPA